ARPSISVTPSTVTPTNVNAIVCGPADLDSNGRFDLYDFSNFARKYKSSCSDRGVNHGPCGGIDRDNDGKVSIADFSAFAQRYYPAPSCSL
ncbi:MAG TPA: hypothetical protein PKU78_01425, partial [Candidatus Dojkabacteria bacterium]|nr:hypothetical protein [Candidatus Dojkabacteria bacterium]